jgi:hypothetical protein
VSHRCRLTSATRALKVAAGFWYQVACRCGGGPSGASAEPQRATRLSSPNSRGVVRSSARSDHCRWGSTPQWARLSSKVASRLQRFMKTRTSSAAGGVWSGETRALGGRLPARSRVRTGANGQRRGTNPLAAGKSTTPLQGPLPVALRPTSRACGAPRRCVGLAAPGEGRKPLTHDARTPPRVGIARWSGLVHHGIPAKRRNQRDLLEICRRVQCRPRSRMRYARAPSSLLAQQPARHFW